MPDDLAALVRRRVEESIATKQALLGDLDASVRVGARLIAAYRAGRKLLLFGNGGSAADAQHIAAEFVGRYVLERRALPALALTVNASSLTAIGNDYGYEQVFARQVEAFGQPGDVAIGISTSGNAASVVEGVRAGRRLGLCTVGLTGQHGGRLRAEVDEWVGVPCGDTPRVQEAHILLGHIWSELVERALFGTDRDDA